MAKLALFIHRPKIVVVAGSANKYFFKQAIEKALKESGKSARKNPKNFNTEIGLPLSILNLPSGYNSFKNWLPAISQAPVRALFGDFPDYLILSLGVADPGDMRYLLKIVKPDFAFLTEINQRYLESFKNMDELVKEYKILSKNLPGTAVFIYNADNRRVQEVVGECRAKTVSFGFEAGADYQITDIKKTSGVEFCLWHKQKKVCQQIKNHGDHHLLAFAAACALKKYAD